MKNILKQSAFWISDEYPEWGYTPHIAASRVEEENAFSLSPCPQGERKVSFLEYECLDQGTGKVSQVSRCAK